MDVEREPSYRILTSRTDAFFDILEDIIQNGLDQVRIMELIQHHRREFYDFAAVYLGINAVGSHLPHAIGTFWVHQTIADQDQCSGKPYIFAFAEKTGADEQLLIDLDSFSIWRPDKVTAILRTHTALVNRLLHHHDPFRCVHNSKMFPQFLHYLHQGYPLESFEVHALLHGYPQIAGKMYGTYVRSLIETAHVLWFRGKHAGIQLCNTDPPEELDQIIRYNTGYRDDLVHLISSLECRPGSDTDFLSFLQGIRYADVPGYQYITSADMTAMDEARVRHIWTEVDFENRLHTFVDSYTDI